MVSGGRCDNNCAAACNKINTGRIFELNRYR